MNYYNEHDPKAAAWLRALIARGHIPAGDVDERDIEKVNHYELTKYTQCHFFAGIGGWPLALRLAGWPESRPAWTGSCPCQPFSDAGQGKGTSDPRHVWPSWLPLIAQCKPPVIFGEQVASKAALGWIDGVFFDLEGSGYACGAADLCAASVGAPHIRQRLFWVADSEGEQSYGRIGNKNAPGCNGSSDGGNSGRLAHTAGLPSAEQLNQPGIESRRGPSADDSAKRAGPGGLGNSASYNERGTPEPTMHRKGVSARRPGGAGGMEHSALPEAARLGQQQHQLYAAPDAWGDFDILPCLDGKARRVESGTFPLAHGVSGRVGLLRGYGNAIVPQIAAEFVKAFDAISPANAPHHQQPKISA